MRTDRHETDRRAGGQAGRRTNGQTDGIAEQRVTGHWIKYARGITLDMVGDVL